MKKILLIPFLIFSISSWALPNGWVITVYNASYQNLVGPTVAPLPIGWDNPNITIPLGFTYTSAGVSTSTLYIDSTNSVGSTVATSQVQTGGPNLFTILINPVDRATYSGNPPSTISYQTSGSANNKIAKIQWRNIGFYGEKSDVSTLNDSTNFQMWFYEADGSFEYRFGTSFISDFARDVEAPKLPIGFVTNINFNTDTYDWFYYLTSLSPLTHDSLSSPPAAAYGLDTYPANGTVIRFGPVPNSLQHEVKLSDRILFYPTVAKDWVDLNFMNNAQVGASMSVLDMNGKILLRKKKLDHKTRIDISHHPTSNYVLQISQKEKTIYYKFSKN